MSHLPQALSSPPLQMALLYLILLSTLLISPDSLHLCFILYKCACSLLLCSVLSLRSPVTSSQVKAVPYCTVLTLASIFISLFCGGLAILVYLYFVTLVSQVKIIFVFLERLKSSDSLLFCSGVLILGSYLSSLTRRKESPALQSSSSVELALLPSP